MATANDRVLIEIITAANMAGVAEAKAGFLGLTPTALGYGVVLGGLYMAGKSAIQIADEQAAAHTNLATAIKNTGGNVDEINNQVQTFLDTNKQLYTSQGDVVQGFAAFVREGVPASRLTKDMATALDIAAAQGISLNDAVLLLQAAEAGRIVGLKKMVGLTLEAIPAHDTLAQKEAIAEKNIDKVAAAYKGSAVNQAELKKNTDELGNSWQSFATGPGQQLIGAMSNAVGITDLLITLLGEQKFWDGVSANAIRVGRDILNNFTAPLQEALAAAEGIAGFIGQETTAQPSSISYLTPAQLQKRVAAAQMNRGRGMSGG